MPRLKKRDIRQRVRPQGQPCEILLLKTGRYAGSYGVKNTQKGWYHLISFNPVKWISVDEIRSTMAWSETTIKYLENQVTDNSQVA